ncbi:ABC-2 family transporter protein [Streptomyces sp. NPDC046821]|uniref:ABC transporter permease n=1 Tax=Streptomyces sp. NPDC046821 TaxID=3154702 RepID=UPI0033CEB85D
MSLGAWRLYAAVAAGGFRRYATYRSATAAGVFTNTVFGFIVAYTYLALWKERPGLGGYDESQALTYVWIGQALAQALSLLGAGFAADLVARIRSGDIAVDLYRPADLQLWWLASDLGRGGFEVFSRGVIPLAVGALFFPLALPGDPVVWLEFLVAVVLAMVVSFAIRYVLALSAFWLIDGSGVLQFGSLVGMFFTGLLLPLNAMPGALGDIARVLPWASLLQMPADILLGARTGASAILSAYAFQAGWALVLLTAGRLMQSSATRKVVLQGG